MASLANIITYEDFAGVVQIDTSKVPVPAKLTNYITEYQERILRDLLGDPLYINWSENPTDAKYTSLRDGETYTYTDGKKYIYTGLKKMLVYFIWSLYKPDAETKDTITGESNSENENSEKAQANIYRKSVARWNVGVKLYHEAIQYIEFKNSETADYYPDFDPCYVYGQIDNNFGL